MRFFLKSTMLLYLAGILVILTGCDGEPTSNTVLSRPPNDPASINQHEGAVLRVGKLYVSKELFLSLTNGMSFEEVIALVGTGGDHQFTILREGHEYRLTSFYVNVGGGRLQSVLFKNGELLRFINMQNLPSSRHSPRIDDERFVERMLNTDGWSHEKVEAYIEDAEITAAATKGMEDPLPPAVLKPLLVPSVISKRQQYGRQNAALLELYNGHRVKLGMTPDEVDNLFGQPQRVKQLTDSQTARIYGTNVDFTMNVNTFSWVAVIFDEQRASKVYSNGIFHRSWREL